MLDLNWDGGVLSRYWNLRLLGLSIGARFWIGVFVCASKGFDGKHAPVGGPCGDEAGAQRGNGPAAGGDAIKESAARPNLRMSESERVIQNDPKIVRVWLVT
jgi:hypothetical protein